LFRTAEGRLGVDDPVAGIELSQEAAQAIRVSKLKK
jgi:hypothetical protein